MKNVFEKYPELREELYNIVFNELGGSHPIWNNNPYNTDVIVWDSGEITTYNYFGNVIHQANGIALIITVSGNDTNSWYEYWQEGMTDEQKEYCKEKDWACCYESDSLNPEDWNEYEITVSDLMDIDHNIVEQAIENYEQELLEMKRYE